MNLQITNNKKKEGNFGKPKIPLKDVSVGNFFFWFSVFLTY